MIPIRSVGLQVRRFKLDREVHVVSGERLAGIERLPAELSVIEDLERHTDWNALVGDAVDRHGACPKQDGVIEGISLEKVLSDRGRIEKVGRLLHWQLHENHISHTIEGPWRYCFT